MRVVISEESHNRVVWHARRPLPQILVGMLSAVAFFSILVAFSPSVLRWQVVGAIVGLGLAIGAALVVTTPLVDSGSLERRPDGGGLRRTKRWLIRGAREVLNVDLEDIDAFDMEARSFEDGPVETVSMGRVWAVDRLGNRVALTDWAEVPSVEILGAALAKAGRRTLSPGASQDEGTAVV